MPAVAAIASAPHSATRAAPTAGGAPPTRAAVAPSATRQSRETIDTISTSLRQRREHDRQYRHTGSDSERCR